MALMTSLDGPLGPGFLPPRGEYRRRYFRFFKALWKESRVDGLMMIADRTSRRGFRNSDRKPRRVRSWVVKLGARCLDLLWIVSCCLSRRFSAMTVQLPPGRMSLVIVVNYQFVYGLLRQLSSIILFLLAATCLNRSDGSGCIRVSGLC